MSRGPLDHMFVEWEAGSPADVEQITAAMLEAINAGNTLYVRAIPGPREGYIALFVGCAVEPPERIQDFYEDWVRSGCPAFNRPTTRPRIRPKLRLVPGITKIG